MNTNMNDTQQPIREVPALGNLLDAFANALINEQALSKQAAVAEAERKRLAAVILAELEEQELKGTRNARITVVASKREYASISDWDQFTAYVTENDAWHLVQRRVNIAPAHAMSNGGTPVPGVTTGDTPFLSYKMA